MKNFSFFPQQTAPKRHSSLFLRTYTHEHARPSAPQPCPALSCPCPHPALPALPSLSAPAKQSGTCNWIFPGLSTVFFSGHIEFFPRVREWGKNSVQKEKIHLLHWSDLARCAAPHRTLCPGILLSSSLLRPFCTYIMLHKSRQLSQISMLTLTVTLSRGSFCFLWHHPVPRREYDEVLVRLSG